jgi:hypothetical protein
MRTLFSLIVLCAAAIAATAHAQPAPSSPLPNWWVEHVAYMTRGGGVWITPNPQAETNNAPDAFGMEWRSVNAGHGLVGRLYGVKNGQETDEYWTFREFWHPGERRVIIEQWGGPGVYGIGETRLLSPMRGEIDQTFWLPDGRSWREGHRTVEGEDGYLAEVYDIGADGAWTLRASNLWRRVAR